MRILQVDYMGCLYWHYHAKDKNPAWNFAKRLRDIIERFQVDKTLLLLEGGSAYRMALHPGYKSERKKRREKYTPAEKREHAAFLKEADDFSNNIAPLFGMIPVRVAGAEADDLAAYFCQHIDTSEHQILNLSGDQDWYQLLKRNVVQASYADLQADVMPQKPWLSATRFYVQYGISVSQWIWMKCLAGDAGDSVAGFNQLGKGTALKLLQKYGSIEEIEKNLDTLDVPRMKQQAKDALKEDFPLVHRNYPIMNLNHEPEVEQKIFGEAGIAYLDFIINLLTVPTRVDVDRLTELSYERGWLEIDKKWLGPFCAQCAS